MLTRTKWSNGRYPNLGRSRPSLIVVVVVVVVAVVGGGCGSE